MSVGPSAPHTQPASSTTSGARAGVADVLRLAARLGTDYARNGRAFDSGAVGCRWARELAARGDGSGVSLPGPASHIELVGSREASDRSLACAHGTEGFATASLKRDAMQFLAPRALTIADGADWARLRKFNDGVLAGGAAHAGAEAFLAAVRHAFARPVRDGADVRAAMALVMARIVLGPDDAARVAADDARVLFDVVQSPLRRRLLGWYYRRRRTRFFATLEQYWDAAASGDTTLIARARGIAADADTGELLDQVPHWMFTFTGSGTDLLTRTLALIAARPAIRDRILNEIADAAPLDTAAAVDRLAFLNACLLETGRLFPPVTRTFQAAPDGRQMVHYFPLLQRDDALGDSVHAFRPERWLTAEPDAAARASNLFLRGPRSCPGRDLILFVCTAAIAQQLLLGVRARSVRLARDPLPVSFPAREARFVNGETSPTRSNRNDPAVEARS